MNSQSDVKINYNNLVEMQEDACSKFSQNPIFGTKNGSAFEWITYAEFAEKVDQFRGGLATLGVGKDDKVASTNLRGPALGKAVKKQLGL